MQSKDMKEVMLNELKGFLQDAVAYIRYSSHMQDGGVSVEYQMKEIEEYAEKNGYRIVEWYIDKAASGKEVAGRDEFLRMYRTFDSKTPTKALIVWSTSRAFRNATESAIYRERLRNKKIKLLSVTQTIDEDTHTGRMMTDIIARIDQYKVEEIGAHVSAAARLLIQEGFFAGGTVPFGYTKVPVMFNGSERWKLIPYEPEAPIIKQMFDLYESGQNLIAIAKTLKKQGTISRKGTPFHRDSIRWILGNLVYVGKRHYKMNDGQDAFNPNYCEPLISQEQFDRVQKLLQEQKNAVKGRERKHIYPLVGKINCTYCGRKITGTSTKSTLYYQCFNRRTGCPCKSMRADWLEGEVLKAINTHILSSKGMDSIVKQVMAKIKKAPAEARDRKQLMQRKSELLSEISEIVQMKLKKQIDEETMIHMKTPMQNEVDHINRQLAEMDIAVDDSMTPENIKEKIKSIFSGKDRSPEALKALFTQTVESIEVDNTQVVIHLRVPLFSNLVKQGYESPNPAVTKKVSRN